MTPPTVIDAEPDPALERVVAEIGEARRQDEVMASLLREVSHRSKNLLAIVLSLAAQTGRHADSIESFLEKFRGRILALSAAQDLITESDWLGTPFRALVRGQMLRGARLPRTRVQITGDNPVLGPNAALHVGLAIHELITNAAAHAVGPGTIAIQARLLAMPDVQPRLLIDWSEAHVGGPEPAPPEFGTLVLEEIVPRSLGGSAEILIRANRVHYHLEMPADQFIA
jgi:two-component sensor histidine kinase